MKISKIPLLVLCSLLFLGGCQYFQFPGVHKINIQQGHIITQDIIEQLEPGMNKRQVRFVLGTPLAEDLFTDNRWNYYYSLRMGDGRFYKRSLVAHFDGDIFTHYTGENLPELSDEDSADGTEPEAPLPTND
ncbi:MAG TPA: outer membrane protein assembly factor BamE [Cellvibrionaceae bacterium]